MVTDCKNQGLEVKLENMVNQLNNTVKQREASSSPGVTVHESVLPKIPAPPKSAGPEGAVRRGLALLHTSRASLAVSGDRLIFETYILNEGTETLGDVRLVPMSFRNADMAQLSYEKLRLENEAFNGVLLPGSFVKFTAQYRVTDADVVAGSTLISAMAATAVAEDGAFLREESDVVLEVGWDAGEDED